MTIVTCVEKAQTFSSLLSMVMTKSIPPTHTLKKKTTSKIKNFHKFFKINQKTKFPCNHDSKEISLNLIQALTTQSNN